MTESLCSMMNVRSLKREFTQYFQFTVDTFFVSDFFDFFKFDVYMIGKTTVSLKSQINYFRRILKCCNESDLAILNSS